MRDRFDADDCNSAASSDLERRITDAVGTAPTALTRLEGGMIGSVVRADLADGRAVVAKVGETPLEVEAHMLGYLSARSALPVPEVYHASDDLLLLEYVDGDTAHDGAVAVDAADHLAALHDRSARGFGFERDTLTGPVRQPNPWTESWVEFYRDHRLRHVARVANEDGALPDELGRRLEAVAADLADDAQELLAEPDAPGLIHGDVWTTNVLSSDGEVRAFLDPATYYANPEIELAYVDWTATFGEAFFDRYDERRGIADGFFERRRYVYRLYPLVVHVLCFGGRYVGELEATLERLGY
ncbi:fructosamine kinase family protein [Halomontanus rarus]|uniref:fructosamine kinase family protein n=1 Tax=Halomontanus rarus TaxID=3034020 RepID=UPI001A98BEB9